ncbi:MAG: HAD hydrolase family protein [Eubacteriales bacterium]|nr:HAD hydrolase family protein [Eubacteriales bacterium]
MIKAICTDLDGTLIPYTADGISESVLELARECKRKGIYFVPATGRPIASMRKQFAPVMEECCYICDNGATVFEGGHKLLGSTAMPREAAIAIAEDFWNNTDGQGEINFSGVWESYLMCRPHRNNKSGYSMEERLHSNGSICNVIRSFSDIKEDIIKVSVFLGNGVAAYADRFIDKWSEYNCSVAGLYWIDTGCATKGTGVKKFCEVKGLELSEVAAFGDNYNDVPMLDIAGTSYIMESSAEELKKRYALRTDDPEGVMRRILASC